VSRPAQPPRTALLLLRALGSPRYRDSLAGDLIEGCARGKGAVWCWREVLLALLWARLPRAGGAWGAALKALLIALGLITLGAGTLSVAQNIAPISQVR
jgi:hypothetical protein